jgi:phage terminase large subunit-like protein
VLADLTSQGETPGAWGARVGAAFRGFKATRVVVEINNGGDMVTEVLRQSEPNLPVHAVHATRGKFLRAEPIAAAYERSLVFHVGTFGKLEDQLCALTPDFDQRASGFSPDRADALVWALADLLGVGGGGTGECMNFGQEAVVNPRLKRQGNAARSINHWTPRQMMRISSSGDARCLPPP